LKEQLDLLRRLSNPLEPNAELRALWTQKVVAHAEQFLADLPQGPAFVAAKAEGKGILSSQLSEDPQDAGGVLQSLAEHVEKPGVKLGSPGYLAFIPISTVYSAALGDYLAAVSNPYVGNFFASPGAVRLEHFLTRWMADFVGYPKASAGDLTSGGSIANLSAIIAAREAHDLKPRDYERAVVYLSSQTHHSVAKALRIAGLGNSVQREISLDSAYRMRADDLEKTIRNDKRDGLLPWLIVAAVGSTDVGAVDPLDDLVAISQNAGIWLHVDGAYGAMFALCEPGKKRLSGIEQSDSVVLDPHKGLFMPCGSGAVLVKNGKHLRNAFYYEAHYMQDRSALASLDEFSPSELSPELTRPFRGLRLWLSLKLIGLRAFRAALEEKLLLASYFYQNVQAIEGIEVGPPPDLSIVAFRFVPKKGDPNEFNQRLLKTINQDGRIFMTSTRLNGQFWLRVAILCAATHREQIDLAGQILKDKLKEMGAL
jgi:glutamate/tyrosine decarboxylase-like PLP-dependent enzyme